MIDCGNVERAIAAELQRQRPQLEAAVGVKNVTVIIHFKGNMIRAVESVVRTEVDRLR